jgi:hypothetical protein
VGKTITRRIISIGVVTITLESLKSLGRFIGAVARKIRRREVAKIRSILIMMIS